MIYVTETLVKEVILEQIVVVNHNISLFFLYICLKTIILFYIFKDRVLLCVRPASDRLF